MHLFIHTCLSNTHCMPGVVQNPEEAALSKPDESPHHRGADILRVADTLRRVRWHSGLCRSTAGVTRGRLLGREGLSVSREGAGLVAGSLQSEHPPRLGAACAKAPRQAEAWSARGAAERPA